MHKIVKKACNKIKEIILKELDVNAIILQGIPVVYKNQMINDIDLYIVSNKRYSDEKLDEIGKKCSKVLGYGGIEIVEHYNQKYDLKKHFHVDIHNFPKKIYPTIRMADLRDRAIAIYGKKPKIPKFKIPKSEKIRFLWNTIQHLVIAEKNTKELKMIYAMKALRISKKFKKYAEEWRKKPFFPSEKRTNEIFILSKQLMYNELRKMGLFKITPDKLIREYYKPYMPRGLKKLAWIIGPAYLNFHFLRRCSINDKINFKCPDYGIYLGFALMYYFAKQNYHAEYFLKKVTHKTKPLRNRLLKMWSIYYLMKLV